MKMQKSIKCKLQKFVNPFMTFYQSRTRFRILLRKYSPTNTVKIPIYVVVRIMIQYTNIITHILLMQKCISLQVYVTMRFRKL